jgi:hypothetical protein
MSHIKPFIISKNNISYLKIDMGSYYYETEIYNSIFTSDILNPVDLVKKAIEYYTNESYKITYNFHTMGENSNGVFEITININNDIIKEKKQFNLPMQFCKKEQIDYINERFSVLEDTISNLKNENQMLKDEMKKILASINKNNTINTDSESSDTSTSYESEKKHHPISKKLLLSKRKIKNLI